MTTRDFRVEMSLAEFQAIPIDDDEWPTDGLFSALIAGNSRIEGIYDEFPGGYEDPRLMPLLTEGQRTLILLGIFDGQVKNGGITQLIWNYREFLLDIRDGLERVGDGTVLGNFNRALGSLVGGKKPWLELRRSWDENRPDWEDFRKSYELLDLGWFDTAYFDRWGENDRKEWVCLARGLHYSFMKRVAVYVRERPFEFITGKTGPTTPTRRESAG